MIQRCHAALAAVLTLVLAGPVSAQTVAVPEVTRGRFIFFDQQLTIDVLVDSPGRLRLIRGGPGQIDVAGRANGGIVGFGLAARPLPALELTAIDADSVSYLIVVPEQTVVRIRLPDRELPVQFGTFERTQVIEWKRPRP